MIDEIINEKIKKLNLLKEAGVSTYPARVKRTCSILVALKNFSAYSKSKKKISIAGRIMSIRDQGNLLFIDCVDETGSIQCVFKKDNLTNFKFLKSVFDRGDFISATGSLFKTKKGEKSIEVKSAEMLVKSIRPLPSDWYGLEDIESRLRERYVDLIIHPEIKEMFRKKSIFWASVRDFLIKNNFTEVETSVLEPIPGGAEANPFVTHHNTLDMDFYMRISLELQLKKLMVGGFENVFEIGRVFRNEGIDRDHLQDYTALEFYWAWHDYNDLMKFTEAMFKNVIKKTTGSLITINQGRKINWGGKWKKIDYVEAFKKANGLDPLLATVDELKNKAIELGIKFERNVGAGRLIDLIYKKTIRPNLIQPCFLINPPVLIEPLAKRSDKNFNVTERMQVVAVGTELGKGFSELNDPIDQRLRFEDQMKLREEGDDEAQRLDEDFLKALEYGMPPTAGFGMSERLFAVLMDKPIRETVFFPLMKTKEK